MSCIQMTWKDKIARSHNICQGFTWTKSSTHLASFESAIRLQVDRSCYVGNAVNLYKVVVHLACGGTFESAIILQVDRSCYVGNAVNLYKVVVHLACGGTFESAIRLQVDRSCSVGNAVNL